MENLAMPIFVAILTISTIFGIVLLFEMSKEA